VFTELISGFDAPEKPLRIGMTKTNACWSGVYSL